MSTNELRVVGTDDNSEEMPKKLSREQYEQKLDDLIQEYFCKSNELSSARKRKKRTALAGELNAIDGRLSKCLYEAAKSISDSSERERFIETIQERIRVLNMARDLSMHKGKFRKKFAETAGGVAGGTAETAEEIVAQTKGPTARAAGHLAEFLTGVLREITTGLWRGIFGKRKAA